MKLIQNKAFLSKVLRLQNKLQTAFDVLGVSKEVAKEVAAHIPVLLIEEIQYQLELFKARKVAYERGKSDARKS